MADYYDRLEAQLVTLTERGAHQRRLGVHRPVLRIRFDLVAIAAAVAVVIAVGAAFLSAGGSHHTTRAVGGAPVIQNFVNGVLPQPSGAPVCNAALVTPHARPGTTTSPGGTVAVYNKPPTQFQYKISVTGLKPTPVGETYAAWLQPEVRLGSGGYQLVPASKAFLLGVTRPPVGADGKLMAVGVTSPRFPTGAYRLLLTLQSERDLKAPHHVVVQGDGITIP